MNIIHNLEELKDKKIIFFDLDDTLIKTCSGRTFPEDITDFRIKKEVLDKILKIENISWLFIVSNQAGIANGYLTKEEFETKFDTIQTFIYNYINRDKNPYQRISVDGLYCSAKGFNSKNRKPNTGMLERCMKKVPSTITKKDIVMCGDASGIHNETRDDFSDSDLRTARNFDIDYIDIDDFIKI